MLVIGLAILPAILVAISFDITSAIRLDIIKDIIKPCYFRQLLLVRSSPVNLSRSCFV